MSDARHSFVANVKDSLGWKYANAFVVVRTYSVDSQDTYESVDCIEDYKSESGIEGISYTANFWASEADQLAGLPSRPLVNAKAGDTGEDKLLFLVDLENIQSIEARNNAMPPKEKHRHLIELEIKRHCPQELT